MISERVHADGLIGEAVITRDRWGIPHVRASHPRDAWFGMGFACAQDRLFQMDYDRRRACGRWAEVAGLPALPADILSRRLGLVEAAMADVEVMSPSVRETFEAYAEGVNWAIATTEPPVEMVTLEYKMEPWEAWHSVAAFKVRHVLMGLWQHKLAQGIIAARRGSSALGRLAIRPPVGSPVTLPPEGRVGALIDTAMEDVVAAQPYLGFLAEVEPGSNAWAVSGRRTAHGAAVLCNDSHRALDVPNVYWQCHVTSDSFDVIGATFAGVPGFPHFGHNGRVAWAITHAGADTQDLYIERFDQQRLGRYEVPGGWLTATAREEVICVRDAPNHRTEVWRTRHGPIVHGDPRSGMALALRYTATEGPSQGFEPMLAMLDASNVTELIDSQRHWVDPVNNLVAADTTGRIAYQTRGRLPIRSSPAHQRLPVPGWTGECEWVSYVPFEHMPRAVDPPDGYLMTANNVICDSNDPYISYTFADPFRAERLRQRLSTLVQPTTGDLAALQADTYSWAAQGWAQVLRTLSFDKERAAAEHARVMLSSWDGNLDVDSAPALLYGCFRRALAEGLYRSEMGSGTWEWMTDDATPAAGVLIRRALANDTWHLLGGPWPPEDPSPGGRQVTAGVVGDALFRAWDQAARMGGANPDDWRWGDHHRLIPRHPLSGLDVQWPIPMVPEPVPMGGDTDTVQAASYGWRPGSPFGVTGLSVYRQVVDMSDPAAASWVIPGGASGVPGTPHFSDQLSSWSLHERIPMLFRAEDIDAAAEAVTCLTPGGGDPHGMACAGEVR